MEILNTRNFIMFFCLLAVVLSRCPPRCSAGCDNAAANTYTCSGCQSGFFVESNMCVPCPAQCETCTSRTACVNCRKTTPAQTQAQNAGACLQCAFNCKTCTTAPTNCASCYAPFTLSTVNGVSTCTPPAGVNAQDKCSQTVILTPQRAQTGSAGPNNINYCVACVPGFFAWQGQCRKCPPGAATCTFALDTLFSSMVISSPSGIALSVTNFGASDLNSGANLWIKESWIQLAVIFQITTASAAKIDQFAKSTSFAIDDIGNPGQFTFDPAVRLTDAQRLSVFNTIPDTPTSFNLSYVKKSIMDVVAAGAVVGQCLPGLYLNSDPQPKCVKCAFPNKINIADSTCSSCETGFSRIGGSCQPCHPSCLTCTTANSATACATCALPTKLVGNECKRCGPECASCDATATNCATCVKPFSRYPDPGTNRCYRCVQDTCIDCLSTNNASCIQCAQGHTLNGTRCVRCQPQCAVCTVQNDRTVCQACAPGFVFVNNNCNECEANCMACSQANLRVCFRCKDGFSLDNNNRCAPCPVGCAECNKDFCLKWRPGFVSNGDSLLQCKSQFCTACDDQQVCVECESGTFLDPNTKTCKKCGPFCLQCSPSGCTRCAESSIVGSGADAGKCLPCNASCASCNPANANQCRSCRPGLFLSTTTCLRCPKFCDSCTTATTCAKCQPGYILNQQGKCTKCAASCNGECSPLNVTQCFSCAAGSQLVAGKCVNCGMGCDQCQNRQCTKCKKGFTLVTEANSTDLVTRCRPACVFPCEKCEKDVCLDCADGFNLVSGRCNINLQCLPANDAACRCPQGSVKRTIAAAGGNPASYPCIRCPNGCQTCTGADVGGTFTTTCTVCLPGSFLDGSACAACPAGCLSCTSATECQECRDGFVNVEGTSTCVPCQNCSTCIGQPTSCLTCRQGFNLVNDKCIGSFTMGFTFVFSDSFDSFMSSGKLDSVITNLATILRVSEERIIINDTRSGSTYVVGGASADSSTEAATHVTTLTSALSSNPSALGSNMLSTSTFAVQLDGRDFNQPEELPPRGPNIPLIVGLTVGLGGGLIITIAVLVYLKKTGKICKTQDSIPIENAAQMDEQARVGNSSVNEFALRKE